MHRPVLSVEDAATRANEGFVELELVGGAFVAALVNECEEGAHSPQSGTTHVGIGGSSCALHRELF